MQNGPRKQGFFIGVLEFGSKEKQTRDSCLGAEKKWVRQNSRSGKGVAVEVAQLWLLKPLEGYVLTMYM